MKKFIDSQVKPKEEREREREERRVERDQERREKAAKKNPHGYINEKDESFERFGRGQTMMSAPRYEDGPQVHHFRRLANPAPLGLFAFGFSAFLLGLVNIGAEGVRQTTALVGPFLLYTAIMMGVAAVFELISGNTFGATAFGTLSGFFLSFGAILYPAFGTFETFSVNPLLIFKFLGLFFATWMIPFGIFCIVTIRSTWTLWLQFIFIFVALTLSTAQYLTNDNSALRKASGAVLIVVALFAYINGAAGLFAKETTFFSPPNLAMPWSAKRPAGVGPNGSGRRHHEHDREQGLEHGRVQHPHAPAHPHPHPNREAVVTGHNETFGSPRLASHGIAPALAAEEAPYRS